MFDFLRSSNNHEHLFSFRIFLAVDQTEQAEIMPRQFPGGHCGRVVNQSGGDCDPGEVD